MKKKIILLLLLIPLLLVLAKLCITYYLNEQIITEYEKGNYKKDYVRVLKLVNINEPYIIYYNEGNIFYQEKEYDKAINNYEKALKKTSSVDKKCEIRINMTLAMLEKSKELDSDELRKALEEARENLYNDHCADEEDDSGESKEAEQLEEEIKKLEETTQGGSNGEEEHSTPQEEEETEEEKTIRKQLEDINKDANASRQSDMDDYKNLGNYQYYSGKNW